MNDIIIPVNDIIEGDKITTGLIVWNDTVSEALQVIYKPEQLLKILHLAKDHPQEGIYSKTGFVNS